MAQIRAARHGEVLSVIVIGRLMTADMRRLEHACAPALISHPVNLELDLSRVTDADATAQAFIARICERGAHVTCPPHLQAGWDDRANRRRNL